MSPAEVSPGSGGAGVLRRLTVVWTDFEGRLQATPLIRKLTRGRFAVATTLRSFSTCVSR